MHEAQLFSKLIYLGLYLGMIVNWSYLWMICALSADPIFFRTRRFGHWLIPSISIPSLLSFLIIDFFNLTDRHVLIGCLASMGVAAPWCAVGLLHAIERQRRLPQRSLNGFIK